MMPEETLINWTSLKLKHERCLQESHMIQSAGESICLAELDPCGREKKDSGKREFLFLRKSVQTQPLDESLKGRTSHCWLGTDMGSRGTES